MADNYRRRFGRDEMRSELVKHFQAIPEQGRGKALEAAAEVKAQRYDEALRHLDSLRQRLQEAAEKDSSLKELADSGIREIDEAIDAYGEASLVVNHTWNGDPDSP